MKFFIYINKITNRSKFIFDLIFKENYNINYKFVTNFQEFETLDGYKLNYSNQYISKVPFINANNLLFEKNLKEQEIEIGEFGKHQTLFKHSNKESDLPFDIFAASFYLISRYEEYLPHKRDKFDRFNPRTSIAYKNKFIEKPLVNIWINQLKNILQTYYPNLSFQKQKFTFSPTFDIDIAYSILHKGFVRNFGGFFKELYKLKFKNIFNRFLVHLRLKKDPYDTYKYIFDQCKKINQKLIFFFLIGKFGVYDKNIRINNIYYQKLIKSIADNATVGIHPSYNSNQTINIVKKEIEDLENVIKRDVTISRQHYLRLELPNTYENLIELDVKNDYTMGYANRIGFRASYANSFYFYNLVLDLKTNLKVHPFMLMDVALKNYMKLNIENAIKRSEEIIKITKKYKGNLITLWHNSSLSETDGWQGWQKVFEAQIKMASK